MARVCDKEEEEKFHQIIILTEKEIPKYISCSSDEVTSVCHDDRVVTHDFLHCVKNLDGVQVNVSRCVSHFSENVLQICKTII